MKTTLSLLVILLFSNLTIAQTTSIPDPLFEQELINLGYDTGVPDGVVLTANINTVDSLEIGYKGIYDLTGIEDFISLTYLFCEGNQLTSLNVTQNIALTNLHCANNYQLTSLNVTQNTSLKSLNCDNNQLTNLNVTQNIDLTNLVCPNNQITNLDITQNTALINLYCDNNQLTSLNVTQNTALIDLNCANNQITSLNITQNTALTIFYCWNNKLTNIDVTQNTALIYLACSKNQLMSLNLTQNTALTLLSCNDNNLNCLNVKNGNNINLTIFGEQNNPSLTCIEVDNATWSTTNWTDIDPAASFSTNCANPCLVGINEHDISSASIYPNPTQGTFTIETPNLEDYFIEVINITGKVIYKEQIKTGGIKQINLGGYSKGIYFLKLTNNKETIIEKIVYK